MLSIIVSLFLLQRFDVVGNVLRYTTRLHKFGWQCSGRMADSQSESAGQHRVVELRLPVSDMYKFDFSCFLPASEVCQGEFRLAARLYST